MDGKLKYQMWVGMGQNTCWTADGIWVRFVHMAIYVLFIWTHIASAGYFSAFAWCHLPAKSRISSCKISIMFTSLPNVSNTGTSSQSHTEHGSDRLLLRGTLHMWDGQEPRHLRLSLGSHWGSLLRLFLHTLPFNCCLLTPPHQSRRGKRWQTEPVSTFGSQEEVKSEVQRCSKHQTFLLVSRRSQPPCLLIHSWEAAYNEIW